VLDGAQGDRRFGRRTPSQNMQLHFVAKPSVLCCHLANSNEELCGFATVDLCHNMRKPNHCLHELLSAFIQRSDSLRARGRDFGLPVCTSMLHRQSFIVRWFFFNFFMAVSKIVALFISHLHCLVSSASFVFVTFINK